MSLTAAELVAYLRLDKGGFTSELDKAQKQMGQADKKFGAWTSKMGDAVAGTITTAAVGATAFGTSVLKTGEAYNVLQQQSRAALTSIMKSGAKANAQMDKLDAFAKTSPFAKDVFIKAQQQLLGFGLQAEDVIPTLQAVQDSVAAMGGTNDDISKITYALAQVQGQGKLSGDTLSQLGQYGIDAASIVGKAMGKTSAEIRDMASKPGGIPAAKVWDPLVDGLEARFAGASAGVKQTMTGAADRIKAAWRDVGSKLAAPFVDPNGGGMAIDWFNDFADVVRAVESKVRPFLYQTMPRFQPLFEGVTRTLKEAKGAVDALDLHELDKALDLVGQHAPQVAALSGAILTMATRNVPYLGALASALGPIPVAIGAAAAASPELRDALGDILDALSPLLPEAKELVKTLDVTFAEVLQAVAAGLEAGADVIGPLVDGFLGLPDPVKKAITVFGTFLALNKLFPDFGRGIERALSPAVTAIGRIPSALGNWGGAMSGATSSMGDFRAALGLTAGAVGQGVRTGLRGALGGLVGVLGGPWGIALGAATVAITVWAQKQAEAKQKIEQLSSTLDDQTGAFTNSTIAMEAQALQGKVSKEQLEEYGLSYQDVTAYALGNKDAVERVTSAVEAKKQADLDAAGAAHAHTSEMDGISKAHDGFIHTLDGEHDAVAKAVDAKKTDIEVTNGLKDSTEQATGAEKRFGDAVQVAGDNTKTAEERARALQDAMDALAGKEPTLEDSQRKAAASTRDLAGFLKDARDKSGELNDKLAGLKGTTVAQSDAGDRLNDLMQSQADKMNAAAIAVYDKKVADGDSAGAAKAAAAEYEKQKDALNRVLGKAKLSKEQIQALNDQYLKTPNEVETVLSLSGQEAFENAVDKHVYARKMQVQLQLQADYQAFKAKVTGTENKGKGPGPWRAAGGIDVKGMAAGGVTGHTMQVAQMVAPGDIRFAGDRKDVDEAWIPLDGSARSWKILAEALSRMPGKPKGMAAGGVVGTIDPPKVDKVKAPDTAPLTGAWDTAMVALMASTESAFQTIRKDTAASQTAQTADTVKGNRARAADTRTSMALMRDQSASTWVAIAKTTTSTMAGLRAAAGTEFSAIRTQGLSQLGTLRSQGVAEIGTMRAGMVDQMGQAQGGFKGALNLLIGVLAAFSKEVNRAYGDYNVNVGTPAKFATGGVLPGYTPGKDVHRFVSPTGGRLELSGGEAILRPEATRALGTGWVDAINAAARHGGVSGVKRTLGTDDPQAFADGGIFYDSKDAIRKTGASIASKYTGQLGGQGGFARPAGSSIIAKTMKEAIARAVEDFEAYGGGSFIKPTNGVVTSPFGASRGKYPHAGVDFAAPGGGPTWAAAGGRVVKAGWNLIPGRTGVGALVDHMNGFWSYYGHNPANGLKVKVGDKVKQHDPIGAQGSTGHVTGPHLHFEIQKGKIGAAVDPMPYLTGAAKGGGQWSGVIARALAANGLPTSQDYVSAWLRQIQTESGGNPSARQQVHDINSARGMGAMGLLQVIPPTFAANKFPGHGDIFNAYDNALAAIHYAKDRYGATGMLAAIGHGHGYERGTSNAAPGLHWVGEKGPELINFRGGETVRNANRSRAIAASSGLSRADARMLAAELARVMPKPGDKVTINAGGMDSTQELVDAIAFDARRRRR